MNDLTGKTLKGYRIIERIGAGGFGEVYRAYQPGVEREVAVKIILPIFANRPDFIRRFETEAQLVARLEHPFIVPIFDFWRDPAGAYLVVRWLPESLQAALTRQGAFEPAHTVKIIEQIASALTVAHRNGIVHRDIKPDNILLDKDGNAYLTDFGIAKVLSIDTDDDEGVYGSPAYMAPEQFIGDAVTPQTDIYQLGVLVFELLTGQHPFDKTNVNEVINRHLYQPFPNLPERFARANNIIQKATLKEPRQRYSDTLSLAADLRQMLLGTGETVTFDDVPIRNPYKGLRAFEEADGQDFFGREKLVGQLLNTLVADKTRFMAVIGPSGSGKSSVIRAGLIPALRQHSVANNWFIADMMPGDDPIQKLEEALLSVATNPIPNLYSHLKSKGDALVTAVNQLMDDSDLLLFIDQFEEIFTLLSQEQDRLHFLQLLQTAIQHPESRLKIIIALRADFYDRPLLYEGFGALVQQQTHVILPLSTEELERAISFPASRVGLQVDPNLLAQVINDIRAEPGALPLLQYALTEVYERREGRRLTLASYHNSGGVLGALARRADEVYASLSPAQQTIARQVFLRLITLGEGTEDTRRRARLSELTGLVSADVQAVLDAFGKYRLLSFDHDPETREPTVEVAHEALIRSWGQLRAWLNDNRSDIRFQRMLAVAALEWATARRDAGFLLTGSRLNQFEEWAATTTVAFTEQEHQYLSQSIAARQAQQAIELQRQARELQLAQEAVEAEKRRAGQLRWFVRWLALGGVILLGVAALAVWLGLQSRQNASEAERRANLAKALALSAQADLELRGSFPERSILLALAALGDYPYTWQAERTLTQAVMQNRTQWVFDQQHPVNGVAFSPDGTQVASADEVGQVFIREMTTGTVETEFNAGEAGVTGLAFSPNGETLLTSGFDGSVRLWDLESQSMLQEVIHRSVVYSAVFNPAGDQVGSISTEGNLRVWEAASGEILWEIADVQIRNAKTLAFSPDGQQIATASFDTIFVWEVASQQEIAQFAHAGSDVNSIAFSPDGQTIIAANADSTLRLWNIASGEEIMTLTGHTASVDAANFSPDGLSIVSASQDNSARVWSADTGAELYQLAGHTSAVRSTLFSPDGNFVATASQDGTVRIWKNSVGVDGSRIGKHEQIASSLVFSPDGSQVVSAGWDRMVLVLDAATGEQRFALPHEGWVNAVTYSPDGTRIATASRDGLARVWDAQSGELSLTYSGHTSVLDAIAFSPDSRWVVSGGADRSVRVWDAQTGETRLVLNGHTAGISGLAFSPDSQAIASAAFDGTIRLWDSASGAVKIVITGHEGGVTSVSFSADGRFIVTGGIDQTIRIWNTQNGTLAFTLIGHTDVVNAANFNSSGNRIVSASDDSTIRVWDVPSRQVIVAFSGNAQDINDVVFNRDGTAIAAASDDGSVYVWQTWRDAAELQQYAQACCVFRELNNSERVLFDLR